MRIIRKEEQKRFGQSFMYVIILIWFSTEIILSTTLKKILIWNTDVLDDQIAVLIFALLFLEIVVFQRYKKTESILIMIITAFIVISTIKSHDNMMMSTWMFIVASKYVDFDQVIVISYYILFFMIAAVVALCLTGIIPDLAFHRGSLLRHSLGFSHPNALGMRVSQLVLTRCYVKRNRMTILDYAIVIASIVFVYFVPNCQTAVYILIAFLVMLIMKKISNHFADGNDHLAKAMIAVAVVSNVMSVCLSIVKTKNVAILTRIDLFASKRFSLCHRAIEHYGLSLFGNRIELFGKTLGRVSRLFYVDTSYVAILLRYGVIVYFIFSAIYLLAMVKVYKEKNFFLCTILCVYAIYGIMENSFYSMTNNIFLIALSTVLYSDSQILKGESQSRRFKRIVVTI